MIFTERTITVVNDSATINKPLILYRGDKNIELKITIAESQFKFRNNDASNVIETTDASYAQLVINTPYNSPIFSDVAVTKNGAVIFVITEAMIDEIREVGAYEIQIRLLDDNKQSRASIPPVSNAIEIREPIAIEDGSAVDSNAVNVAKVNRALTTTSAPLEAFDSQGNYIKKTWGDGDPITDAALNKMEAGIDGVNKKVVTKTSQLTNDANYVSESFVTNKIAEAQLGGGGVSTTEILPNVVLFGDSITDTNVNGMWVKHIQEHAKFKSLTNYARGYCTWTFKSDSNYNITDTSDANIGNNVIWNQFNRMKNDIDKGTITEPDCIVILAGTNDALQGKTLGDVNTVFNGAAQSDDIRTLTNLCASIRYVCELIMNTYPRCQIILCTPLQAKELNTTTAAKSVGDTIKQCASIMGCKVIDQWSNSGIYQYKEKTNNVHMRDNVHLNNIGGQDVAKFLAREFYNKINLRYVNASQEPVAPAITLKSISATFNQGSTAVYTSTSLDELKSMLTVIATYSDNSTQAITDYELSGTLTVGTSIITVTKGGLTATFDVIVSESTSGGEDTPTTVTYFRNELLGTCTNGVWEDTVQIPDQVIPSGSKLKQFKCNAFANNGTAYLAAFTKNNSDFTPVYVKQVTFNKGENTFDLDYTCEQDIYFGWKTTVRDFIGMDLSTLNGTPAGSQQYNRYWSLSPSNVNYIPEIGVTINNLINTNNKGIGFDCLLVVEQ